MKLTKHDYLLTIRLNQDSIENLFSKGGARDHLTLNQSRSAYRHVVFDILIPQIEATAFQMLIISFTSVNCIRFIVSITNIIACRIKNIAHHSYSKMASISQLLDMNIIQKTDIFAYMAGYLF